MITFRLPIVFTVFVVAAVSTPALARADDIVSTRTYIRADYALVHAAKLKLPAGEAASANLVKKITHKCSNVAAGSPNNKDAVQLGEEALGAVGIVISSPNRKAIVQLLTPLCPFGGATQRSQTW
jgi:hypothetical protein